MGCSASKPVSVETTTDTQIQTDSFATPYWQMKTKASFITSDKLLQCYIITQKNELKKYNAEGTLLFQFNNNYLGELQWVDVTDPFNLLLFYPEYLTVITLDRTLSKTGEYQLYDLDIVEVEAVAMSNDNHLWLYDVTSSRIRKIDQQGKLINESGNLSLLLGGRLEANLLMEHNNLIYMNVPDRGILVFDNFATYIKTIPIKNLNRFQLMGQQLIFEENGSVYSFHLQSLLTKKIELPCPYEEGDQLRVQKDILFLLRKGELFFYRI